MSSSSSSESEDEMSMEGFEISDTESDKDYVTNENHAVRNTFKIGQKFYTDLELTKLVKSSDPEDKARLNDIVKQIMNQDLKEIFGYLLFRGYDIGPMNDKGQNAVHLLFYHECQRILDRQKPEDLAKKTPAFGSRPADGNSSMDFLSGVFFNEDNKKLLGHSFLLDELIQTWLVKGDLDLKPTDAYGLTYLHIACLVGENNLVKKSLKNGLDVNARFNHPDVLYKNYTPLHFGVLNPLRDTANIVNTLLKNGANVEARDSLGRTPLHLACRLHHAPYYIVDRYQNLVTENMARYVMEKPEDFFAKNAYLVTRLLKKNSDVNAKDEAGNTPLLSLFPEKYNDEVSRFRSDWHDFGVPIKETIMKFAYLVKAGADLTIANDNGDTILHLITNNLKRWRNSSEYMEIEFDDSYHTEMIRVALESCPQLDVNVENKLGDTPLRLAVDCLSFDIVKLMCKYNADLSTLKLKENLFCYPNIAPNYEATRNLVSMAELFETSCFKFTEKAHFKVLEFFIHSTNGCQCIKKDFRHYALLFGSKNHVKSVLNRVPKISSSSKQKRNKLSDIVCHLDLAHMSKCYIDEEIRGMMEDLTGFKHSEFDESGTSKVEKELKVMKSTFLEDKFSVYDVITRHSDKVPRDIVNNFNDRLLKEFNIFGRLVKGNITKAIIRYYIVKSASPYVQDLLLPFIPDVCCDLVMSYLSNEDIFNVCVAMCTDDITEKQLLARI